MYNRLIKSISNSCRYPLRNLNSLLTKLFHLPSKYINHAHTILYIQLHVPFYWPRVPRASSALGLPLAFPSGTTLYIPDSMGAHLPLASWINRLVVTLFPGSPVWRSLCHCPFPLSSSAVHRVPRGKRSGSGGYKGSAKSWISPFIPFLQTSQAGVAAWPMDHRALLCFQPPHSSMVPHFSITTLHPSVTCSVPGLHLILLRMFENRLTTQGICR